MSDCKSPMSQGLQPNPPIATLVSALGVGDREDGADFGSGGTFENLTGVMSDYTGESMFRQTVSSLSLLALHLQSSKD